MIFGKNKEGKTLVILEKQELAQSYWSRVKRRFQKNKLAKWSLRLLIGIFLIAVFSDFIANEKPLYCKIKGKTYFPILKQYAVDLGLSKWDTKFYQTPWQDHDYESVIMPPIPYSHFTLDNKNVHFVSPFGNQNVPSNRFWHWLGTDQFGRDVLAGMIRGTRVAMLIGVLSMFIAALIGLFLGSIAGFFGDTRFRISRVKLLLNLIGIVLGYFYAFSARIYTLSVANESGTFGIEIFKSVLIFFGIILLCGLLSKAFDYIPFFSKEIIIPFDLMIMRLIEIVNAIPSLFFLLAAVTILEKPSIVSIMIIIGFLKWTSIARFVRAELLRVRSLEFIEAANAMGFSDWRIIIRHAIPNSIAPVLITIAFGVASAILIEAFLSFLGIGLENDEMTWGLLLSFARESTTSWWLAIFPGFAIFITVTLFNLIGDGLADAFDSKLQ
ncbi:MAG: ABC transporter permease [Saprospiraceae bacterium]|nr:ABC transporter permease [bacterium]MDG1434776.1 ABC transporter permease [Saprospiraceae bacterium]MDG2418275.1 ABC transporter permease [Saprospiraceae bacterium]